MNELEIFIDGLLTEGGISPATAPYIRLLILLVMLGIIAGVAFWITKAIVISSLYKVFRRTRITWDDALVEYKVFNNVAHIIPAAITRIFAQIIFRDFEQLVPLVIRSPTRTSSSWVCRSSFPLCGWLNMHCPNQLCSPISLSRAISS